MEIGQTMVLYDKQYHFSKLKYLSHWFLIDNSHLGSGTSQEERTACDEQYFSLKSSPRVTKCY